MLWNDVIGHAQPLAGLRRQVEAGTLPHALLIVGPDQIGKTTLARAVSTALLDATAWPGGLDAHPDAWIEDSESERIGIDRIRPGKKSDAGQALQEFMSLRAYAGGRRVAILARAERLTEQASNALLKTLEEPPAAAHIILTTSSAERLPETIQSRCQSLLLTTVATTTIEQWLRERGVAAESAGVVAVMALGRPGRADALSANPQILAGELDVLDRFLAATGGGAGRALEASAALAPSASADGREKALAQLEIWASFIRDVICWGLGVPELARWVEYRDAVAAWADAIPAARGVELLTACLTAADAISVAANPRLTYDVLFLSIFAADPAPPVVAPRVAAS